MCNRIYEWVGRGTWQVITQVISVVGVELLSRLAPSGLLNVHI
jgi:hypothetical protein